MSNNEMNQPTSSRLTIALHIVQALFAIPVMGLAGYAQRAFYSNPNVYAIICSILTIASCIYLIGSLKVFQYLCHSSVVGGLHLTLVVMWLLHSGLMVNQALDYKKFLLDRKEKLCVSKGWDGLDCAIYYPSVNPELYSMIAGSVFGAVELLLWITSLAILTTRWVRTRKASFNNTPTIQVNQTYDQSNQMEQKIPTSTLAQPSQQPYVNSTTSTATLPTQYHQSAQGPFTQPYQQNTQEPVLRANTVSPISSNGPLQQHPTVMGVPKTSGAYSYDPDLPELSTPFGYSHRNNSTHSVPKHT